MRILRNLAVLQINYLIYSVLLILPASVLLMGLKALGVY